MKPISLALVIATTVPLAVSARGADAPPAPQGPVSFEDYAVFQYAATDGPGPVNILKLDTNGAFTLAARTGIARATMKERPIGSESQIALLKTFRLLEERNDTLWTAFPILGPGETARLRERVRATAPTLADRLKPEVRVFVEELGKMGRERNAYTMLFSYVLDGLVWKELERRSLVEPQAITADRPLWAGEVWAIYPARAFSSGTNSISEEGVSLKVNWTERVIPRMLPFLADFPTLVRMFQDYRTSGRTEDPRVREVFGPYGLFDGGGRFTIPVLVEEPSDPLYRAAISMTETVASVAPGSLHLGALVAEFGFRDEKQALVVAYHELMWDVMDRLEAGGLVSKPAAFSDPSQAKPPDIADLVFIVREAK